MLKSSSLAPIFRNELWNNQRPPNMSISGVMMVGLPVSTDFCSCILVLFSALGPNGGHVLVVGPVMWDLSSLTCGVPPKFQYKDFGFQLRQTMFAVWNLVRQHRMFLFPILSFVFMYFGFVFSFGAQRRPRSRRGSCHVRSFKSHLRSASKISV